MHHSAVSAIPYPNTVGSSEAWHGYGMDTASVKSKHIECVNGNYQGKCGLKSARKSEYSRFAANMSQTCHKSDSLHGEYFFTSAVKCLFVERNKRSFWESSVKERLSTIIKQDSPLSCFFVIFYLRFTQKGAAVFTAA